MQVNVCLVIFSCFLLISHLELHIHKSPPQHPAIAPAMHPRCSKNPPAQSMTLVVVSRYLLSSPPF
jgi:hypothetical protein